jgi:hypothetical protein
MAAVVTHAGDRGSISGRYQLSDATGLSHRGVREVLHTPSHRIFEGRPRYCVAEPTEIALRERIVAGALNPDVETDLEWHGSGSLEIQVEAREERAQTP